MTERPILFSGPMVRAILSGTKTQTRRIVKPQPNDAWSRNPTVAEKRGVLCWADRNAEGTTLSISDLKCPYGKPGDCLWVRENFWQSGFPANAAHPESGCNDPVWVWEQEVAFDLNRTPIGWRKRPSIHMPRWASRITLEVVSVRVERLQDISEADAIAEGVWDGNPVWPPNKDLCPVCHGQRVYEGGSMSGAIERDCTFCDTNVKRYKALWQHINGGDSWEANPWVWVVEFRKLDQP